MSPILVRPVREQLEHDRIIRLLHSKFRRRYDAAMNPGAEQNVPVRSGALSVYPDLVLTAPGRGRRLEGVIEVETGESVNHLEALAQWAHLSRLGALFYLYVPSGMVDVARRLCDDNRIPVDEIWSYHAVGDEVRFTIVHRLREPAPAARRREARPAAAARRKAGSAVAKRPARTAKPASTGKPARKSARAQKRK